TTNSSISVNARRRNRLLSMCLPPKQENENAKIPGDGDCKRQEIFLAAITNLDPPNYIHKILDKVVPPFLLHQEPRSLYRPYLCPGGGAGGGGGGGVGVFLFVVLNPPF